MFYPEEHYIYQLLNKLEDACTCTDLICLHCQAAETIDNLIIQNLINHYQTRRRTWRCRR